MFVLDDFSAAYSSNSNAPRTHFYTTDDAAAVFLASGYFNAIAPIVGAGDTISVYSSVSGNHHVGVSSVIGDVATSELLPKAFITSEWEDLRFPFIGSKLDVSSGRIDYNYTECTVDWQANARYPNEPICMVAQMPHDARVGGVLRPHIHWIQNQAQDPNFVLSYRHIQNGGAVGTFGGVATTATTGTIFPYSSGSILQITTFPEIDTTGWSISDTIDFIIFRDTTNAAGLYAGVDPYVGVLSGKEFDIHYERDSLGSTTEFVK